AAVHAARALPRRSDPCDLQRRTPRPISLRSTRTSMCRCYSRLGGVHLVTGVAVVRNATQDRDRERWLVGVVCEAVPFAFRDEDEVAFLEPDRLDLRQGEPRHFEDQEILFGVRMAVDVVPGVGRGVGD